MAEEKIVVAEEATEKKAPAKKAAAKPAAEKKPAAKKAVAKADGESAAKKAPAPKAAAEGKAKKAPAKKAAAAGGVTIKLVKSLIARSDKQIATAHALGLKKVGDVTVQPDNVATAGKINKISHMVEVTKA